MELLETDYEVLKNKFLIIPSLKLKIKKHQTIIDCMKNVKPLISSQLPVTNQTIMYFNVFNYALQYIFVFQGHFYNLI